MSLLLVSISAAALAPISAQASNHTPWDQPGSAWQGTVTTDIARTYTWNAEIPERTIQSEDAIYTELVPNGGTSDGYYGADLASAGTREEKGVCSGSTGGSQTTNLAKWEANHYAADVLYFETDDMGVTSFLPGLVNVSMSDTSYCYDPPLTTDTAGSVLGFESGASGAAAVLNDDDPDPLRLVGTTSWSLNNPPYELPPAMTGYSFTVTYDLRLVTEPCPTGGLTRDDVIGRQPRYVAVSRELSSFPNDDASCFGMWAPHLDAGFVPQGIAPAADLMWVAGYFKVHKDDKPVECAVYLMDPMTGRRGLGYVFTLEHLRWASVAAGFDKPRKCGHAGGVALLPDDRLLVADTKSLFVLNPAAFGQVNPDGGQVNPIEAVVKLVDPVPDDEMKFNGSFLVDGFASTDPSVATVWIGTFDKAYAGRLREVTIAQILGDNTVSASDASQEFGPLPVKSQGGAFAANGDLWIASSTSGCGMLTRFDAATGENESFGFGPGAEEISFVGDRLWAAFEAGTRLYGKKFFPLIASFKTSSIVEGRSAMSPYCLGLLPYLPF